MKPRKDGGRYEGKENTLICRQQGKIGVSISPIDFLELPQTFLPPLSLEQEQAYPFELSFHGMHLKIASHSQLSQLAGILKILQSSC